jgi:hypothetical protein
MLRDRAGPIDLFALVPALELRFEPELAELDRLLEDDELFEHVKAGLSRRWPHTTVTGRPSTPVLVVLRVLVIQHLYAWSASASAAAATMVRQAWSAGSNGESWRTTSARSVALPPADDQPEPNESNSLHPQDPDPSVRIENRLAPRFCTGN